MHVPVSVVLQFQKRPVGAGLLHPSSIKLKAPFSNKAPPLVTYWNENCISVMVTFAGTVAGFE